MQSYFLHFLQYLILDNHSQAALQFPPLFHHPMHLLLHCYSYQALLCYTLFIILHLLLLGDEPHVSKNYIDYLPDFDYYLKYLLNQNLRHLSTKLRIWSFCQDLLKKEGHQVQIGKIWDLVNFSCLCLQLSYLSFSFLHPFSSFFQILQYQLQHFFISTISLLLELCYLYRGGQKKHLFLYQARYSQQFLF